MPSTPSSCPSSSPNPNSRRTPDAPRRTSSPRRPTAPRPRHLAPHRALRPRHTPRHGRRPHPAPEPASCSRRLRPPRPPPPQEATPRLNTTPCSGSPSTPADPRRIACSDRRPSHRPPTLWPGPTPPSRSPRSGGGHGHRRCSSERRAPPPPSGGATSTPTPAGAPRRLATSHSDDGINELTHMRHGRQTTRPRATTGALSPAASALHRLNGLPQSTA